MRPTVVDIDLSAIKHNIEEIKGLTGVRFMMVIKADAYGHGAREVGKFVEKRHLADMFGVTSIEEAIELRDAGIGLPILVFGLADGSGDDIDALFEYNLTPTIVDTSGMDAFVSGARRRERTIYVHLKVDTGMGRLGLLANEALEVLRYISEIKEVQIGGVYTHFPVADTKDKTFTIHQIEVFGHMINEANRLGMDVGIRHCANSGAILNVSKSYMDMVRPGLLCYGLYPSQDISKRLDVIPAMTLKTSIMFIKRVKKGTALSYGLTYKTKSDTYIATLPVGYADGYFRALSNKARVIIQGKTYPVVGRVCMDQILIDLGDDLYPVGQEVILFGKDIITAETVASWCDTIPYEITCNMSRRVVRTYSNVY
ncbi:MAG: alanine racemase [Thermodesulfobacteriota bacterium]|nr:alanine racemase [Thermodesulfobacteriota bacterium]